MATYSFRIEWADGRVDLANSVYAARALVLARYPGTLFEPEETMNDGRSTRCFQRQPYEAASETERRLVAVIHRAT